MRVVLTAAVIAMLLLTLRWIRKSESITVTAEKGITVSLLVLYIIAVLFITLGPTLGNRRFDYETHLILNPFHGYTVMFRSFAQGFSSGGFPELWKHIGWYKHQMSGMALNVLLFVPLGYLVPSICVFFRRWWKVLLLGAVASLTIETTQLITHLGWFDASDLLHNTLGTLIGYALYKKLLYKETTRTQGS